MTMRGACLRSIAAATALAALAVSTAAAAAPAPAVSPPGVDDGWLPEPAPPSPPQPTVQREVCAAGTSDPDHAGSPRQLDGLGLAEVWRLTRGTGQRVAVIDTGVSPHRRLAHLVAGGDYVSSGDGIRDCDGHGTAVAGIIAATPDPDEHFAGVAPAATVIGIRQSSTKFGPATDASATGVGDVATLASAVRTAADLGATVINISPVACVPSGSPPDDRALGAALAYAVDVKDTVVVAAAGNTGGDAPCPPQRPEPTWDTATVVVSPAWYDEFVLTVGSVAADGTPSAFTLAGPWVDVAAPGEAVVSLGPVGDAMVNTLGGRDGRIHGEPLRGTSYAAPVVSGLAALIRSRFPALTAQQVMARLKATAHHPPGGWDPVVGNGVVDAAAAVSTDAPSTTPAREPDGVPVNPQPAPAPANRRGLETAVDGAAACLAVLVGALATSRLRRAAGSHDIPGD